MRQVEAQRRVEDLQHAARQQARRTAAELLHKVQHRVEAGQLVERGAGEGGLEEVGQVLVGGGPVPQLGVAGKGGGQQPLVGQRLEAQHVLGGLALGAQAEGGGHSAHLVLAQRQVPKTFAVVVPEMEGITEYQ